MALLAKLTTNSTNLSPKLAPLIRICGGLGYEKKKAITANRTISNTSAFNKIGGERDRATVGTVDGNKRIYQVVARPVLNSSAAQAVRHFCWLPSNCTESKSCKPRQNRDFSSQTTTTKRKMVNIVFCTVLYI